MRWGVVVALAGLAGCATAPASVPGSIGARPDARPDQVTLEVSGPPIAAEQTERAFFYEALGEPAFGDGGLFAQRASMMGREDLAAKIDDYASSPCEPLSQPVSGSDAVLDEITARAADARVVIINESHSVTRHRDFASRVAERLLPLGFSILAAETFSNQDGEADPVEVNAALPYHSVGDGYYSSEPAFGRFAKRAKELGYRLAAYEKFSIRGGPARTM